MEKILLPLMIQDPSLEDLEMIAERFEAYEPYFLDGPISERVAVIDFDDQTGAVVPGAKYTKRKGRLGKYVDLDGQPFEIKEGRRIVNYRTDSRAFNQVSVFSTVLRTMKIFEESEVLGRRLHWAFDSPQLLVIPRAGVWANAYYDRQTHSLQFFYFKDKNSGETVYSSLSRDIVSHEAAHAILDGIAPDLYNAITPQSQAIHETIADITAVLMSLVSNKLKRYIVHKNQGDINNSTEFSRIGEQFGRAIKKKKQNSEAAASDSAKKPSLRELSDINPFDKDEHRPHKLSVTLSAALYSLLVQIYEDWWAARTQAARIENIKSFKLLGRNKHTDPKISGAHEALRETVKDFSKMVLGALDFLPPGEVSFADFGRAMYANQQNLVKFTAVAKAERQRAEKRIDWLIERFEQAGIIENDRAIKEFPVITNSLIKTNFKHKSITEINLDELVQSDWVAYQFANENRRLLGIPGKIPFEVRPRLAVKKLLYEHDDDDSKTIYQKQIFFKVSWEKLEDNVISVSGFPRSRRVKIGTTLVIDADSKKIIARLRTDDDEELETARSRMITELHKKKLMRFSEDLIGPDGDLMSNYIPAENTNEVLHINGVSRLLHIIDTDDSE